MDARLEACSKPGMTERRPSALIPLSPFDEVGQKVVVLGELQSDVEFCLVPVWIAFSKMRRHPAMLLRLSMDHYRLRSPPSAPWHHQPYPFLSLR